MRLLELGAVILGLAVLARIAARFDLPTVPLYLLAGLAFGEGGILPLVTTRGFVETGAEIGLILVLFVLGLEHSSKDLLATARSSAIPGLVDLVLNAAPGVLAGLLLGWGPLAAAFLGGITYVSSSGVAAKLLEHAGPHASGASRFVVTLAVIEDLVMAIYLPVLAALLIGDGADISLAAAGVAILAVPLLLVLALRVEVGLSQMLFSRSDEALLLSILGFAIVIAGVVEVARFSAAVGALLAGIMLSGPAAEGAQTLVRPLRDLFAAIFFAFIGLSVDPSTIPPVLGITALLGLVTAGTKFVAGWWSARRLGSEPLARGVVGAALIPRGEFSIAIAGLAAAATVEEDLGAFTVAYVILTVVVGSVVTKVLARRVDRWEPSDEAARHVSRFPTGLDPVEDLSPSPWVQEALKNWPAASFRVRDLVPPVFEAYARILHRPNRPTDGRIPTGSWAERASEVGRELGPKTGRDVLKGPNDEARGDAWRAEEGSLIELEAEALGSLLSRLTSTPLDCWFAMWSGWGDLSGASGALYRVPEGTIAELRIRWRSGLESWRARREAARLKTFPLLGQSGRSYLLFHGAVDDAARFHLAYRFQSPALWWPQDRAWFVHTEIDGTSTYVGGSRSMIGRLVGEQILESFEVDPDDPALL